MRVLALYLIGLSIAAFMVAAFLNLTNGNVYGVVPEGFSRASSNLSLIAVAIGVWRQNGQKK